MSKVYLLGLFSLLLTNIAYADCSREDKKSLYKLAKPYSAYIIAAAKKYHIDIDLIYSVITIESCFRETAVSPKGAQGLMQLMPDTAERFGGSKQLTTVKNIYAGTRYLRWLSKRYKKNIKLILAAYNAGEGAVDKYKGIPPYKETQNYIIKTLKVYKKMKQNASLSLYDYNTDYIFSKKTKESYTVEIESLEKESVICSMNETSLFGQDDISLSNQLSCL